MASPPPNQRFSNLPQGGAGQRESQHLQQQQQDQQNYSNMYAGNPGSESHGLGQQGQQQSAQPYNFNPVRSSASSGSGSGSGSDHHASSALGRPLSPSHRNSTYSMMDQPGNTVGLDSTSAAIARGEVGANYSRYSTGNLAALAQATGLGGAAGGIVASNSNHRLSSLSNGNGTEELQIEMDSLPAAPYANSNSGLLSSPSGNAPFTRSRFSEYGLGDASSSESPSFRDSTLFDSNDRRGSMQYYSNNKSMEDTSLLWNEKNVEADEWVIRTTYLHCIADITCSFLHDPRTLATQRSDRWWNFPTSGRGLVNAIGISVLLGGFLALFMGWPIHVCESRGVFLLVSGTVLIVYRFIDVVSRGGTGSYGWNMGNTNSSGQVPDIPNLPSLIDADTPDEVKYGIRKGYNGRDYQLVFSDEFNEDGRTFFPGDDPFVSLLCSVIVGGSRTNAFVCQWEAVDIHYWQTRDLEWYDPDVPTTRDGNLEITLTEQPIHGLNFRSGMIQSWNKLCFNKGAYIEVKASLPGNSRASGYWPGIWTMGNLGRAGYGATNDGMWRELSSYAFARLLYLANNASQPTLTIPAMSALCTSSASQTTPQWPLTPPEDTKMTSQASSLSLLDRGPAHVPARVSLILVRKTTLVEVHLKSISSKHKSIGAGTALDRNPFRLLHSMRITTGTIDRLLEWSCTTRALHCSTAGRELPPKKPLLQ